MDPFSIAVTLWLLWLLAKRAPGIAQDLADAIRNGLDRDALRDQLRRMRKAGIPPARSGPLWRRMLTNAYREGLGSRLSAAGQAAGRAARRLDAAAARAAERLRSRHGDPRQTDQPPVRADATVDRAGAAGGVAAALGSGPDRAALPAGGGGAGSHQAPPSSPAAGGGARPMPGPPTPPPTVPAPRAIPATTGVVYTATAGRPTTSTPPSLAALPGRPAAEPLSTSTPAAALPAGTATAVLDGEVVPATPTTAGSLPAALVPLAIEGAGSNMSTEVTGVVSGAVAARVIGKAVDDANSMYRAALARARAQALALMEQTIANVEFAGSSDVVAYLQMALEAISAAEAAAARCGSEVGPLMHQVARAFDRRNS